MTKEIQALTPETLANGKVRRTFGFAYYKGLAKADGLTGKAVQEFASNAMRAQSAAGLEAANRAVELGFVVTKADLKVSKTGKRSLHMVFDEPAKKDVLATAKAKLERAQAEVAKLEAAAKEIEA
jgi:hypothetical protein